MTIADLAPLRQRLFVLFFRKSEGLRPPLPDQSLPFDRNFERGDSRLVLRRRSLRFFKTQLVNSASGGSIERLNDESIIPVRLGHIIDRLGSVPPAVELTNLLAIRAEECRRQIHLSLRNGRAQKLTRGKLDKVRVGLAACQFTFNWLAGFEQIDLGFVLRGDDRS